MQANAVKLVRYGKHDVIMPDRQGALNQILDPEGLFCSLAFGTVPVAATVVAVTYRAAFLTHLFVSSKRGCSAIGYFAQDLQSQRCERCPVYQLGIKEPDHIGQFKSCSHGRSNCKACPEGCGL